MFVPLSVLAVVLSWPGLPLNEFTGQLETLYAFIALIGVVSLGIIGMLYKIIPFLVWFATYSRHIGLARVPSLSELYSEKLQIAGFWSFVAGLATTCIGIIVANEMVVRFGAIQIAFSLFTLAINLWKMSAHFLSPQTKPLVAPSQMKGAL